MPYISQREVPRGTLLNRPDAPSGSFHLVLRGRLRAYVLGPDRRRLLLDEIETGGFDGILPVAGHRGHFTQVVEEARLASMELRILERLTRADHQIGINLLRMITTRLEQREDQLEMIALHAPGARLARQLLALARAGGVSRGGWTLLARRLTHQTLADMLGVRRETVTLHLRQLTERGAIRLDDGHLLIDRERLHQLATETGTYRESTVDDAAARSGVQAQDA
jgi:CRP/FNR family transcriptional regulator